MLEYLRITNEGTLPDLSGLKPYKAVVVIETLVEPQRQTAISKWLVASGCLYMMAWGPECSSWDDSVDMANLEGFNFGEIPDESFVMTTWHDSEPLEEVFWFARYSAIHPVIELENTLILHVGETDKSDHFKKAFNNA